MDVVAVDELDEAALLAVADLLLAVADHDGVSALHAVGPREGVAASLAAGREPDQDVLVVRADDGVGLATLPRRANTDRASLEVSVHPRARGRGLGRALLTAVVGAAAERGRTTAELWCPPTGPALAAARHLPGLREVMDERESVLVLDDDARRLARDAVEAGAGRAERDGYQLRGWEGPCPADLVEPLGEAHVAMDDAPVGESSWRPGPHGSDQDRALDRFVEAAGLRHRTLVAVHEADGAVAGFTDVAWWPGHDRGEQWDTGVVREHRGHGLGLLLKASMALDLAADASAPRVLHTSNAESNSHMLAVNEALGWRAVGTWTQLEGPLAALTGR